MTTNRIAQEKATVELMIRLYCRRKEGNGTLCPACSELLDYALNRLDRCRFGHDKPTCRECSVHCYNNEMRERIRSVMRWAGPRMVVYHPVAAVKHLTYNPNTLIEILPKYIRLTFYCQTSHKIRIYL